MLLRAYPGLGVGAEHGLDSVPALGLDEPFVCAVVADAPVDDITLVVGVLQHAVHAGQSEGTRGAFRAWHAAQTALREFGADLGEAVVPGSIGGERPLHERGTLIVDLDVADFAAEVVTVQGVAVSDRGAHRRATGGGFLDEAFHDLVGKVLPHRHGEVGWQHLAFSVASRADVDRMHAIALDTGWAAVRDPKRYPRYNDRMTRGPPTCTAS